MNVAKQPRFPFVDIGLDPNKGTMLAAEPTVHFDVALGALVPAVGVDTPATIAYLRQTQQLSPADLRETTIHLSAIDTAAAVQADGEYVSLVYGVYDRPTRTFICYVPTVLRAARENVQQIKGDNSTGQDITAETTRMATDSFAHEGAHRGQHAALGDEGYLLAQEDYLEQLRFWRVMPRAAGRLLLAGATVGAIAGAEYTVHQEANLPIPIGVVAAGSAALLALTLRNAYRKDMHQARTAITARTISYGDYLAAPLEQLAREAAGDYSTAMLNGTARPMIHIFAPEDARQAAAYLDRQAAVVEGGA